MSTNKTIRELARIAEALGMTTEVLAKNKHIKLLVRDASGREGTMIVAVSGGSNHLQHNQHQLKRFARGGSL